MSVEIVLDEADLSAMAADPRPAVSQETTFLSIGNESFADMSDNPVVAVPSMDAVEASSFVVSDPGMATEKNTQAQFSSSTKAMIETVLSFVLMLIFITVFVFVAPRWNTSQKYSPVYWEQKTNLNSHQMGH